jgi:hypothetical protein
VILLERTALSSSNLVSVGFEPDEDNPEVGTLEVEFNYDIVYQYSGIPKHLYEGLLFAVSAGKYFKQQIAESYRGQRIA